MSSKYAVAENKSKKLIKKTSIDDDQNYQHFKNNYYVIQLQKPKQREALAELVFKNIQKEQDDYSEKVKKSQKSIQKLLSKAAKIQFQDDKNSQKQVEFHKIVEGFKHCESQIQKDYVRSLFCI